ncbi:MAG: ubiquinol-cytochrome c reductase iron-sulfur subunit [Gemmatimonadetes bacterium]|nr:ubiquinol-cytochrome c reductase iron-sulfur subunit [Gemmatimonadota bacterium]
MGSRCDRRAFVGLAAGAVAATVFPGCASVASLPVRTDLGIVRLALRDHPRLTQPGGSLRIQPEAHPTAVYVLNLGHEFAALSPVCQHQGCIVNIQGARLVCPCHGSTYDRDGSVLRGPTERPLIRYPATVTDTGELVIRLAVANRP